MQFELLVTKAPDEGCYQTTCVSTPTSTALSIPLSSRKIPRSPAFLSPDNPQFQELLQAPQRPQLSTSVGEKYFSAEVKAKQKENEEAVAKDQFGEIYDAKCCVM
jgi:hypothetical protein